jgi:REP element-mobilizing transposase RayT
MRRLKYKDKKQHRLPEYDYSQAGDYFVTIVVKDLVKIFGRIENGRVILSEVGKIAGQFWTAILDEWVVMPDHLHGIIIIIKENLNRKENLSGKESGSSHSSHNSRSPNSFHSYPQHSSFNQKFSFIDHQSLQRRYYQMVHSKRASNDRIIRNEFEFFRI